MVAQAPQYPNALRACIKQAGYSFREVSRETTIPESTLYDWAAGNRVIPHRERQILAHLLGCSVEALAPESSPTSIRHSHLVQGSTTNRGLSGSEMFGRSLLPRRIEQTASQSAHG